jgi:ABC-type uncharacterized transport system ATPase subunit
MVLFGDDEAFFAEMHLEHGADKISGNAIFWGAHVLDAVCVCCRRRLLMNGGLHGLLGETEQALEEYGMRRGLPGEAARAKEW